jgi:hypothetical protein
MSSFRYVLFRFFKGDLYPSFAHSAPMRVEDFFCTLKEERTESPRGALWDCFLASFP